MKYGGGQDKEGQGAGEIRALNDQLDINKIAEIKKKILSNRRTRIKMDGEEGSSIGASFADMESDR